MFPMIKLWGWLDMQHLPRYLVALALFLGFTIIGMVMFIPEKRNAATRDPLIIIFGIIMFVLFIAAFVITLATAL
jgi:hypothetical protein